MADRLNYIEGEVVIAAELTFELQGEDQEPIVFGEDWGDLPEDLTTAFEEWLKKGESEDGKRFYGEDILRANNGRLGVFKWGGKSYDVIISIGYSEVRIEGYGLDASLDTVETADA